jgi:hypothetical protein
MGCELEARGHLRSTQEERDEAGTNVGRKPIEQRSSETCGGIESPRGHTKHEEDEESPELAYGQAR